MPPEVSCTQAVSDRLASVVATGTAASGVQRIRTAQSERPSRWLSSWPTTRTPWSSRILRYRRAMVCSDVPRTSAIRLNETRPST